MRRGENAGHPDSPLYTLTKPASIASGGSLVRFDAPPNSVLGAGKTYAVVIIYNKSFDKYLQRTRLADGEHHR